MLCRGGPAAQEQGHGASACSRAEARHTELTLHVSPRIPQGKSNKEERRQALQDVYWCEKALLTDAPQQRTPGTPAAARHCRYSPCSLAKASLVLRRWCRHVSWGTLQQGFDPHQKESPPTRIMLLAYAAVALILVRHCGAGPLAQFVPLALGQHASTLAPSLPSSRGSCVTACLPALRIFLRSNGSQ